MISQILIEYIRYALRMEIATVCSGDLQKDKEVTTRRFVAFNRKTGTIILKQSFKIDVELTEFNCNRSHSNPILKK